MEINQFLHVAILVSNLEKSKIFYEEILQLSPIKRDLNFSGIWYQLSQIQIHLIVTPNLTIKRENEEKWGRNSHIALRVDNLNFMKEKLEKYGFPIQMSASGRAALFTQDPDGNIIEISQ